MLEQCRRLLHCSLGPDPLQDSPEADLLFCSRIPGLCILPKLLRLSGDLGLGSITLSVFGSLLALCSSLTPTQ